MLYGNLARDLTPSVLGRGEGDPPSWGHEGVVPDPAWVGKFNRSNERPKFLKFPDRKPTICASSLRTLNTQAKCGSDEDYWYYAPWRYPGISPVIDPCGVAGAATAASSGDNDTRQLDLASDECISSLLGWSDHPRAPCLLA